MYKVYIYIVFIFTILFGNYKNRDKIRIDTVFCVFACIKWDIVLFADLL